jgi:hypothetical protein
MQDLEQTIRQRAYHLWVEGGRKDGDADAHWLAAQREVLSASLFARVTKTEQPKIKQAKKPKFGTRKRAA